MQCVFTGYRSNMGNNISDESRLTRANYLLPAVSYPNPYWRELWLTSKHYGTMPNLCKVTPSWNLPRD